MISYAQNAEDVVLERVFKDKESGVYIDIGACHPDFDSVTKHFYQKGWTGVNVEPDPHLFQNFVISRPLDVNICVAIGSVRKRMDFYPTEVLGHGTLHPEILSKAPGYSIRVPCMLLSDLIDTYGSDYAAIDFLKIDVEGGEYDVIASGDWERHRPRVLIIEAVGPTGKPNFEKYEALLTDNKYVFGLFDGLNRFYCRQEEVDELLPLLSAPANLFDGFRYIREADAAARAAAVEADAAARAAAVEAEGAAQLRAKDARISELDTELNAITELNKAAEAKLKQSEDIRSQLKQILASANERCDELSVAAAGQQAQAEAAEAKLKQSEDIRSQLAQDLRRLQDETLDTKQHLMTKGSQLASATIELASLSRALKNKYVRAGREQALILQVDDIPRSARRQLIAAQGKLSFMRWVARRRSKALMATRQDLISTSGLFDPKWYLAAYPDVAEANIDALEHFNENGSLELRSPGPLFDSKRYLADNPDVRAAGLEPFMHYLIYGRGEGRLRSVDGGSQDWGLSPPAAREAGINEIHFQELIKGFCIYALGRVLQDEEIFYWRQIILERGLTTFIEGILGSPEARNRKEHEEKVREEASTAQLRRIDGDAARHPRVDELVQEISGSKVRVGIAPAIFEGLPFPLTEKLLKSTAIDLDRIGVAHTRHSIAFHRKVDSIDLSSSDVVHVVLLDSQSRASDWLSKPTYRVGRTAEMSEERKTILRQMPAGWEVGPVFHLHRVDGFDRVSLSPAVIVQQLTDEHRGNHDLACRTAAQLVLCHYVTRDAAEALLCLDRFDRRLGSTFTDRYKAITGAYA
jgi:FkbM family methyltransferase